MSRLDEHLAFLKALEADEDDAATRAIYADWLDDHDEPEEADRMRAWPAAKRWLEGFAGQADLSYRDTVNAGYMYAHHGDHLVQYGQQTACDAAVGQMEEFWKCWSIVTGVPVPEEKRKDSPFSCSC